MGQKIEVAILEPFFISYMVIWILTCLVAIGAFALSPESFSFSRPEYRRFMFVPWKLTTFAVATIGFTFIAPYTGDPTWDHIDGFFMSTLTFLSAPWVVGTLYLTIRRRLPLRDLYVALCLWMFSASWSYDLYLVLRDGHYPETWLSNLCASSVIYFAAGLLWNLDWRINRGVTFSFLESDWPSVPPTVTFARLFWYALPFMLIVTAAILYFVVPNPFD
ncbi:MAG: hypothetical protein HQK58_03805 [Deltaproteobacteria bacterium]|nr:hypothetical protein [Deltaproteobacteria bacterium]